MQIKRISGELIIEKQLAKVFDLVEQCKADLGGADLRKADLRGVEIGL